MSTNINLLGNALKKIGVLIFLFIASPILLTMAFKAINKFTDGYQFWFSVLFVVLAVLLLIFTIYFAFKTFGTISKAIFGDSKK